MTVWVLRVMVTVATNARRGGGGLPMGGLWEVHFMEQYCVSY